MLIYVEILRLASYNRALIGKQTSLHFGVIFFFWNLKHSCSSVG